MKKLIVNLTITSLFLTLCANDSIKPHCDFRDFEINPPQHVKDFYAAHNTKQTLEFVLHKKAEYSQLNKAVMSIWDAFKALDSLIDESDPDIGLPQSYHAFQTAEALRKDNQPDWLIVTGLIHDLGKMLTIFAEPQWAIVGDTFPVGCKFSEKIVFHKFFENNPDFNSSVYQTQFGVYSPACGLSNVHMSWGHDEYMYYVAKQSSTLPEEALYIIRYHSFYALHREGEYNYLLDDYDKKMLSWVKHFNSYDLYSKTNEIVDFSACKPYYQELVAKFFPENIRW